MTRAAGFDDIVAWPAISGVSRLKFTAPSSSPADLMMAHRPANGSGAGMKHFNQSVARLYYSVDGARHIFGLAQIGVPICVSYCLHARFTPAAFSRG